MTRAPFVHGQGARGLLAQRRDLRHHHRLALRQPADEGSSTASIRCRRPAENVAEDFQVSARRPGRVRAALAAARRQAQAAGFFAEEIVAGRRSPRRQGRAGRGRQGRASAPDTTLEALAKLKTPFRKPRHRHRRQRLRRQRRRRRADRRLGGGARRRTASRRARASLGMASAGVPPRIMGIGPVPATQKLLARLGLKIGDYRRDRAQRGLRRAGAGRACASSALPTTPSTSIRNGGAIALGHPLGMSGARLALTAAHRTGEERRQARARHHVRRRRPGRVAGARAGCA